MTAEEIKKLNDGDKRVWISRSGSSYMRLGEIIKYVKILRSILETDYDVLVGKNTSDETTVQSSREAVMVSSVVSGVRETLFDLYNNIR